MKLLVIRGPFLTYSEVQNFIELKDKIDVSFCSSEKEPDFKYNKIIKLKTYDNYLLKLLGLQYYQPDLWKVAKDFDICHGVESYLSFSYTACKSCKENSKKFVFTQWETIPGHPVYKRFFRKKFSNYVIKNSDLIHCASERAKDCILKLGADEEKCFVLKFGTDLNLFKPMKSTPSGGKANLKKELKIEDKKVVLFVGRYAKEKGINVLIDALKEIRKENKDIVLITAGSGNIKKTDGLINLGFVPYFNLPRIYNACDVFCLPSIPHKLWEEQFGRVLIEAMACGKPAISTSGSAIPEVMSNKEGLIVQPDNKEQLKDAVKKLLENDNLRKKLGRNARVRAEKDYDRKKFAEEMLNKYKALF